MSRYLRPKIKGARLFFTVALAHRGGTLLMDEVEVLRSAVRCTKRERPFEIAAWVVLPDHLHAVWVLPDGDCDFSTRWSVIKARFSRQVAPGYRRASHILRRERGVWQRRFWEHHIRSQAEFVQAVRYCHDDPVRHGLVGRPEAWPFSTIHRNTGAGPGTA